MVKISRKLAGSISKVSIRKHLTYDLKDFTIEDFKIKGNGKNSWKMVLEVEMDKYMETFSLPTKDKGFASMTEDSPGYPEALGKKIASIIDFHSDKLKA